MAEEEDSSEAWPLVSPPPLAMGGGEARSSLNGESRDSAPEPAAESGEGEGEAGILGAELQTNVPEDFTITEKAPYSHTGDLLLVESDKINIDGRL